MSKHRLAVIAIGLAVSAVFVYLALRGLALDALGEAFRHSHVLPWLPLGIASYGMSHVVRGVRCRRLVRRQAELALPTATNIVVAGYAANNVLPARLGEIVRAGLLADRARMPVAQALAVTFIERVLDGLTLLLLLVLVTATGHVAGWIAELVEIAVVVFGVATAVMFAAALAPGRLIALAGWFGGKLAPRWRARLVALAGSVTGAGACLRDPRDLAVLAATSLVAWCFDAGLYVLLLPVFGLPLTVEYGVVAMCVTGFGLLLPSSPGAIGPFHYFASRVIVAFGVAQPTALAYATLVHLAFYVPVTIWGLGALLWYGVRLGSALAPRAGEPGFAASSDRHPAPDAVYTGR
jgi:glycosyltransferase 2 family protein